MQSNFEIWYPERAIIELLKYQISFTSSTKWWNGELNYTSI